MILRAVVCPGAPLLIPGLADDLRAQLPTLIDACDRAVERLRAVDRILLLTSGPRVRDGLFRAEQTSVVHPPGTPVSSAVITGSSRPAHFTGRLPGTPAAVRSAGTPAGVGVLVGAALLARAGIDVPVTAVDLAARTAEVTALLSGARTSGDRVGLLVVAEGSADHGENSPGDGSPAGRLDRALAVALGDGHPGELHRLATAGQAASSSPHFTSAAALLAMAELTASRPPELAELLLHRVVLGVGHLVATWSWAG